jgi:hypothetical protein
MQEESTTMNPVLPSASFPATRAVFAAVCLLGGSVHSVSAQVLTLSDSEFAPSDWTVTVVETLGNGGSGTATQITSGGNPDAYRRVHETVNGTGANSLVRLFHAFVAQPYDPGTSGPVASIAMYVDSKHSNPPFPGSSGQAVTAAIHQNGVVYIGGYVLTPELTWTPKTMLALTEADFVELGGTGTPDFSGTAAPFEVGFTTANSGGGMYSTDVGYDNFRFELTLAPVTYCTAGSSASGCRATLSVGGTPSASAASGFSLMASSVEGAKDGLFFFGTNGRQANSWGNGTSYQCVVPPVKRGGLLNGVGTSGLCNGSFSQDMNALWSASPLKNPGAGATVQAQLWYRDPFNTSNQTTSLSDALEFVVAP